MPAETVGLDKKTCELIAQILQTKWCPNAPQSELLADLEYCTGEVQRRRSQAGKPQATRGVFHNFAFSSLFRTQAAPEGKPGQRLSGWEIYGRVYHCVRAPGISLASYIERLAKYFRCSVECFPIALALIDRFVESTEVAVDPRNVFRLFLAALLAATKSREDVWHTISYYAHVGGVSPNELRGLEIHFCFSVGWNLLIPEYLYNRIALGIGMSVVVAKPPVSWREFSTFPTLAETDAQSERKAASFRGPLLGELPRGCPSHPIAANVVRTLSNRTDRSFSLPTTQPSPAVSISDSTDDLAEHTQVLRVSPFSRSHPDVHVWNHNQSY